MRTLILITIFSVVALVPVLSMATADSSTASSARGRAVELSDVVPQKAGESSIPNANSQVDVSSNVYAQFDWAMPDRFSRDIRFNDLPVGLTPPKEYIHPSSWTVTLDACSSSPDDPVSIYTWELDGAIFETTECRIQYPFPALGTYPVKLTITTQSGKTASVTMNVLVKDLLIVSLGDSLASGEGNPDRPGSVAVWEDTRCHRSWKSGPVQAALALEEADHHTSITFISLACSGASIPRGLIGPYDGQEPPAGRHGPLLAQVAELSELLCFNGFFPCREDRRRQIDALMISIGANDLRFSSIVEGCATNYTDCDEDSGLRNNLAIDLNALPEKFDRLNTAIQANLTYSNVYITEYPDPTHGRDGDFCEMNFAGGPLSAYYDIEPKESKWAFNSLLLPLASIIEAKADCYGWTYVGRIMSQFRPHGWCADDHWIIRYGESFDIMGRKDGTMHPNGDGHIVFKDRLVEEISARRPELHNLEGYLDGVDCDVITGWAWDSSRPDGPIYVDIYDSESDDLVTTVLADAFRPDLLAAGKGDGFHSFNIPVPPRLKDSKPRAVVVRFSGTDRELGNSPGPLECGLEYAGYVDAANCDIIAGWAWDSTKPDSPIDIDIYDGDTLLKTVPANLFRPDLLSAGIGNGFHAFHIPTPPELKDKQSHEVSVRIAGTFVDLVNSPTNFACGLQYAGFLDAANCDIIAGWAWDSTKPNSPITVDVYDGNTLLMTVPANLFRPDLPQAGIGNGFHAFHIPTPAVLKDRQPHNVSVKISESNIHLNNSPKTITCGASFEGFVDSAGCVSISGWAWDQTRPDTPISVDVYAGTTLLFTVLANQFRPDLVAARKGNGYHGFTFATPTNPVGIPTRGVASVTYSVRFSQTVIDLINSPRRLNCRTAP